MFAAPPASASIRALKSVSVLLKRLWKRLRVPFADKYPNVKLIVSHLGHGYDGCVDHQIRAIKAAKNGNIYTDVSSARSLLNNLVEWAVEQVTCHKILFGTDTPLHHIPMMTCRIETANLSEQAKKAILYQNTYELFGGK